MPEETFFFVHHRRVYDGRSINFLMFSRRATKEEILIVLGDMIDWFSVSDKADEPSLITV